MGMRHGKKPRGRRPKIMLIQLPVLPPAALADSGNSALAPACLAVAAAKGGFADQIDVEILRPGFADGLGDAALVEHVVHAAPRIVCFSMYLWNSERSMHIARQIRRRLSGTTVLIGGPDVEPDNTFLLAQEGIDIAIRGEAEEVFPEAIQRFIGGRELDDLPGLAMRTGGRLGEFSPSVKVDFPLTNYPSPYLTGMLPIEPTRSMYIETARGCPSRCEFCYYSRGDTGIRRMNAAAVGRLIEAMKDAGAKGLIILDPSFNLRPDFRQMIEAIALANKDKAVSLFAEIKAENLEPADMDLLAAAGFTDVEIGLQSVNSETLTRLRRSGNAGDVASVGLELKKRGIEPRIDLMVGLPGDTTGDIIGGLELLAGKGLSQNVQVLPLSVLPGTLLRQKAEGYGLVYDPAPPYRVIRTREISEDALVETMLKAEDILDRRLDEYPRPHLVSVNQAGTPPDVLWVDAAGDEPSILKNVRRPCASHTALWFDGKDLFERREMLRRVIEARMATDPHCILDIVLVLREGFPLDLVDYLRQVLENGPATYFSRQFLWRPGNPGRRICAVVPVQVSHDPEYLHELAEEIPVFADMNIEEALAKAEDLGESLPGARILGAQLLAGSRQLAELAKRADPESVVFESKRLEAWWTLDILGYRDAPKEG